MLTSTSPTSTDVVGAARATEPAVPAPKRQPLLAANGMSKRFGQVQAASVRARVGSLSGGQRQAVAIARSLPGQPRIVILDEPTAALGVVQTAQVLELIHRLRAHGLAVVVISHDLETIHSVADRIVVLRLGHVAGSFDRRTTPREEVVAEISGAAAHPVA